MESSLFFEQGSKSNAGTTFLLDILSVVALGLGGIMTYYGLMNIGDLVAFLLYMAIFTTPILPIDPNQCQQYLEGIAGFSGFVERS